MSKTTKPVATYDALGRPTNTSYTNVPRRDQIDYLPDDFRCYDRVVGFIPDRSVWADRDNEPYAHYGHLTFACWVQLGTTWHWVDLAGRVSPIAVALADIEADALRIEAASDAR